MKKRIVDGTDAEDRVLKALFEVVGAGLAHAAKFSATRRQKVKCYRTYGYVWEEGRGPGREPWLDHSHAVVKCVVTRRDALAVERGIRLRLKELGLDAYGDHVRLDTDEFGHEAEVTVEVRVSEMNLAARLDRLARAR